MSRNLREQLQECEADRKNIIHNIQKLESQIYEFEGSYLKETGAYGNAVKVQFSTTVGYRKIVSFSYEKFAPLSEISPHFPTPIKV